MRHVPLSHGCNDGGAGVRFWEDGREWKLPGLLYADDLVLGGELEEDLKVMVEQFFGCVEEGD